jgi:hypothetical protein
MDWKSERSEEGRRSRKKGKGYLSILDVDHIRLVINNADGYIRRITDTVSKHQTATSSAPFFRKWLPTPVGLDLVEMEVAV